MSAPRCPLLPRHAVLYFRVTLPSTSYITLPSTSASPCPLLPSALYFHVTLPSTSALPSTSTSRFPLLPTSRYPLRPCHAALYFSRHAALYFVRHKSAHSFSDDDGTICLHRNAAQHVPSLGSGGTSPAVEDHRNVTGSETARCAVPL